MLQFVNEAQCSKQFSLKTEWAFFAKLDISSTIPQTTCNVLATAFTRSLKNRGGRNIFNVHKKTVHVSHQQQNPNQQTQPTMSGPKNTRPKTTRSIFT